MLGLTRGGVGSIHSVQLVASDNDGGSALFVYIGSINECPFYGLA